MKIKSLWKQADDQNFQKKLYQYHLISVYHDICVGVLQI